MNTRSPRLRELTAQLKSEIDTLRVEKCVLTKACRDAIAEIDLPRTWNTSQVEAILLRGLKDAGEEVQ